eukprot:UN07711
MTPLIKCQFSKTKRHQNFLENHFQLNNFCKGMFGKHATKHLRVDTLKCRFSNRHQIFVN